MNFLIKTKQKLAAAFMHYVCIRLNFRSRVLQGRLQEQMTDVCLECCPAKA